MVFIKNNKKITNGDYQKINNVNRDKALSDLRGLIAKELIKPQGVGSGTYYILTGSINDTVQISFNDLEAVSDITNKVPINNEIIVEIMKNLSNNERLIIEYLIKNQTISNNEVRNL